jgi:hypothetical protein
MAVVRISKGKFNVKDIVDAERLLVDSERALREPLSRLRGLLHYYVGIDRDAGYLTNVSVWDSLEAAHQRRPPNHVGAATDPRGRRRDV